MTTASTHPPELIAELRALGAPAWYLDAVTQPQVSRFITAADGTPLHLAQWNEGERDKPVLLLLHGSDCWHALQQPASCTSTAAAAAAAASPTAR